MESYILNNGKNHESEFALIRSFNKFGAFKDVFGDISYHVTSITVFDGSHAAGRMSYLCYSAQDFEKHLKCALKRKDCHSLVIRTGRIYTYKL